MYIYTIQAVQSKTSCFLKKSKCWLACNSVFIQVFLLFQGKLLVVAIVAGICGIFVLKYHPNVHFVAAPIGVVAVFSYLSAHCFLTVYEMVIDTLLLCFCEDSRVNDGTPGREYFMHKSLLVSLFYYFNS